MKIAIYAGSFDPITLGHQDLIQRAATLFDKVIVGIGVNSSKKPLLTLEERTRLIVEFTEQFDNVEVEGFEGLLIAFAKKKGATALVRGLRAATDFDYELGIAQANRTQDKGIDTVFLPTEPAYSFVSSSMVKELAKHNGYIGAFVSYPVARYLRLKFGHEDDLIAQIAPKPT